MNRHVNNWSVFIGFSAVTGAWIAVIVWLYLKLANVGVTVVWHILPKYMDFSGYTIAVCLIGGCVIGIFHKVYGPYPETMAQAVKRVRQEKNFDYRKLPMIITASFLSLFFGGSVGPEAGLVSLLLGIAFWTRDQFSMQRARMRDMLAEDPDISRGKVFWKMVRGLALKLDKIKRADGSIVWKRSEAVSAGVSAGLTALIVYIVLNVVFGNAVSIPHLEGAPMTIAGRFMAVPLIAAGFGAGYLYLILHRVVGKFFQKLEERNLKIMNAILGGLILGLIGTWMPMSMFSGGNEIQAIQYEYLRYTPVLLIVMGVVKLFLTNVCVESGWRGGQFFPLIFSGLSIGYGMSALMHISQIFAVVLVTTALVAVVFQQPLGAIVLSLIFFPVDYLGWMAAAAFAGGCIPQPEAIRMNPENKGFIYRITHRKSQAFIED